MKKRGRRGPRKKEGRRRRSLRARDQSKFVEHLVSPSSPSPPPRGVASFKRVHPTFHLFPRLERLFHFLPSVLLPRVCISRLSPIYPPIVPSNAGEPPRLESPFLPPFSSSLPVQFNLSASCLSRRTKILGDSLFSLCLPFRGSSAGAPGRDDDGTDSRPGRTSSSTNVRPHRVPRLALSAARTRETTHVAAHIQTRITRTIPRNGTIRKADRHSEEDNRQGCRR